MYIDRSLSCFTSATVIVIPTTERGSPCLCVICVCVFQVNEEELNEEELDESGHDTSADTSQMSQVSRHTVSPVK